MNDFLGQLNESLQGTQQLLIAALIMGRTASMVAFTPFLGAKTAPPEVKMGLSVMLTLVVFDFAKLSAQKLGPIPFQAIPFVILMLKEIFIGLCLGFVVSKIFWAMEVAGRIIDTVRGASMAEVMVPQSGSRATPFGDLLYQLLVVFFVVIGGHRYFIEYYAMSFEQIPLNQTINLASAAMVPFFEYIIRLTADLVMLGVLIATPVVAATFISDVVFGILNRVAPQLNAYFMSMPVKAMAGVIMVLLMMEPFAMRLQDYVIWQLNEVETTLEYFELGQSRAN